MRTSAASLSSRSRYGLIACENLDIFDFELTDDEMTRIAAIDTRTILFFDNRDPREVSRLGTRRVDRLSIGAGGET